MLSRSQAFAAAFSAKKALLNVNATVNAERTFTFIPSMPLTTCDLFLLQQKLPQTVTGPAQNRESPRAGDCLLLKGRSKHRRDA